MSSGRSTPGRAVSSHVMVSSQMHMRSLIGCSVRQASLATPAASAAAVGTLRGTACPHPQHSCLGLLQREKNRHGVCTNHCVCSSRQQPTDAHHQQYVINLSTPTPLLISLLHMQCCSLPAASNVASAVMIAVGSTQVRPTRKHLSANLTKTQIPAIQHSTANHQRTRTNQ